MDKQEFDKKVKSLRTKFESDKKELALAYAKENNPYKIGDTITDHAGSLIIERIDYSLTFGNGEYPCCVYSGTELKKDGTPKKNQEGRGVYQSNLHLATPTP
jgi:hypothetical protein